MGLIHSKLSILLLWCTTTEDLHQQKKTQTALSEQHIDVHLMSWVTGSLQAIFRLSGWDKDIFRVSAWARFHLFWRYFDIVEHFRDIIQNPSTACWLTESVSRPRLFRYVQCRYTNTPESLNFSSYDLCENSYCSKKRAQANEGYCGKRTHLSALVRERG